MSKLDILRAELIVAQEALKESREKVELLENQIDALQKKEGE